MARNSVLVVEDDRSMQEFYRAFFSRAHKDEFAWRLAKSGEEALKALGSDRPDVVVLDWGLPGLGGLDVLRSIRSDAATRNLLVFAVTALARSQDCVRILESGADDYLPKPFAPAVLLARLRSLSRRMDTPLQAGGHLEIDGLRLDLEKDALTMDGLPVPLHPKEVGLLKIFLRRPNMIHSMPSLWESLWGYQAERWEHTLSQTISSLKKKLGPKWSARLEFHKDKGYLLSI